MQIGTKCADCRNLKQIMPYKYRTAQFGAGDSSVDLPAMPTDENRMPTHSTQTQPAL